MILPLWLALAFVFCVGAKSAHAADVSAPVYKSERCCELCPEVRDASRYDTKFLKGFSVLVAGEGDWLFRSQDFRTAFDLSKYGQRRLQQLHGVFAHHGIEVVLVHPPTRALVHRGKVAAPELAGFDFNLALANYKALLARFSKIGFHVPDLSLFVDEHEEQTPFYFHADTHWTPYGAQRTAKVVADAIHRLPAFSSIGRREFVTRITGRMGLSIRPAMRKAVDQICGTSHAQEYADYFVTEPKYASGGDDLFGDSTIPQIVLVGTSYSGLAYNFAGFLQEYLGADVLNTAVPGGGLEGAMVEYLGSDEFRRMPPKILVWEFPRIHDLDMDSVYRQLFALLDGGCDNKVMLLSGKALLRPGKQEVLLNSAANMFTNREARMEIRFADTSVKKLSANFLYMNGRHESLELEKPAWRDTNGRFVFDLREDGDWAGLTLLSVELEGPEAGSGPQEVELRVCRRKTVDARR
ncbi:MAG: hypothetical protein LBF51_08530 [Zoogloeaceae bacterium]|jgi:alginate biosynthesis protein AlgX|nr:hypothetical protein [Zoogloeaceae bacterium]